MKNLVKSALATFDIAITRHSVLQTLYERSTQLDNNTQGLADMAFLRSLPQAVVGPAFAEMARSNSQFRQDVFALVCHGFKRGGFFVEFGATDGLTINNTQLMERHYGWTGILAEPARCWHEALRRNRRCGIDTRCVWRASGEQLEFNEVANAALSTISAFSAADFHARRRANGQSYAVETVSLAELLRDHQAPRDIDYLSIDTEGSEFDILAAFDFDRHRFGVISCEHNQTPAREKIRSLLEGAGYRRTHTEVSHEDDWYIHPALVRL